MRTGTHHYRQGVRAVSAGIQDYIHLRVGYRAVFPDSGLQPHRGRMAGTGGDESFPARVFYLHGLSRFKRQSGRYILQQDLLLGTEAAADAGLYDAYLFNRHFEGLGHDAPHVERHLRGGPDDQPAEMIETCYDRMRFYGAMLEIRHPVGALYHEIRVPEPFPVFNLELEPGGYIMFRIGNVFGILFVVNNGSAVPHGFKSVEYRGKDLVLHFYKFKRLFRRLGRLGGHGGDPVSDETHLVVQDVGIVGRRLGIALAGRGMRNPGHVLIGKHGFYAGNPFSFSGIYIFDAGMGVRAPEDAAVKHAVEIHVVGENRFAAGQAQGIHLQRAPVDHF